MSARLRVWSSGPVLFAFICAALCVSEASAAPSAAECSRIKVSIAALSAEIRDLQIELQFAASGAKSGLAAAIATRKRQLAGERGAGAQCPISSACGQIICTSDSRASNPRCKICRTDNCDGSASVSTTC